MAEPKVKRVFRIGFRKDLCKRCGICIKICPKEVFDQEKLGYPIISRIDDCTGCGLCEQHCPDFALWVQNETGIPEEHPAWAFLRMGHMPSAWCAGCGIGTVLYAVVKAIQDLELDPDRVVMVSGIGCSSRMPGYLDANTLHTTHGRSISFAVGVKLANPDLKVFAVMGDGDAAAIGGNHLIHAARRNLDMTAIVINNYNYGMTGGQGSPTTPLGAKTTTTPYGALEPAFDLCELVKGAGANYVARTTVFHFPLLARMIKEATEIRGFGFVDVLSNCPTYYGRFNLSADPYETLDALKGQVYKVGGEPREGALPMGVLHKGDKPSVNQLIEELIASWKG